MKTVSLTVNGKAVTGMIAPRTHLADFLRESLLLTGTHIGCEHGVCGACTLLIDGAPARSCITLAAACDGAQITTIEGLGEDEVARQLRAAFSREHGLQCGYCTPGMIMTARDIVTRLPDADEQRVRHELSGNLCRCTGYVGIVRAVLSVIEERRASSMPAVPAGRAALGPVGSGHAAAAEPISAPRLPAALAYVPQAKTPAMAPQAAAPVAAEPPAGLSKPATVLHQSFAVDHPRERVWAFFERLEQVVECMPGAALTEPVQGGHVRGKIRIKLGPIAADFAGEADIEQDPAHYRGWIRGAGRDARSGSAARGEVSYALVGERSGAATRVDLEVGYSLTGALAQFGRSGIVNDLAGRLVAAFAQNLQARLDRIAKGSAAAGEEPRPAAQLDVGALFFSVVWARFKALFAAMFRR